MNTVQFLSVEWAETYRELWNATPTTRDGTKELDMLIEWRVPDGRAAQIDIKQGEAVYGGAPLPERKPDFILTATTAVWKKVATGEISAGNAIMARKIKFVGPVKVAISHMPALSRGLTLAGEVDGLEWDNRPDPEQV